MRSPPASARQELLARRRSRVSYEVTAESGPPHRRKFEVAAIVDGERIGGSDDLERYLAA